MESHETGSPWATDRGVNKAVAAGGTQLSGKCLAGRISHSRIRIETRFDSIQIT